LTGEAKASSGEETAGVVELKVAADTHISRLLIRTLTNRRFAKFTTADEAEELRVAQGSKAFDDDELGQVSSVLLVLRIC